MNNLDLFSKPIVVVFIGNVGAGKTTHIYALSKVLSKLGYTVHVTTLKTVFPSTRLASSFTKHNIPLLRIAVCLDLVFNIVRLPILALIKTVVWPLLRKRQIVLLDEYLPGSLVDYIYNGVIYGIVPVSLTASKILIRLFTLFDLLDFNIVYLYCDKEILPKRWAKRGTSSEKKLYLVIQDFVFVKFIKRWSNVLIINSEKEFNLNHRIIRDFVINMLRRHKVKQNLNSCSERCMNISPHDSLNSCRGIESILNITELPHTHCSLTSWCWKTHNSFCKVYCHNAISLIVVAGAYSP